MAYKRISPQPVVEGGTGIQSATAYAPIVGGTTSTGAFQSASTGLSTSGYVLTSNGSSALPSFQAGGGGVAGSQAFFYYLGPTSTSISIPSGGSGYYLGSTVALTSTFDTTGGNFSPGTGSGTGSANGATFTAPATGLYQMGICIAYVGPVSGSNGIIMQVMYISGSSTSSPLFYGNGNNLVESDSSSPIITNSYIIYMTSGSKVGFFTNVTNTGGSVSLQTNSIYSSGTSVYGYRVA